MGNTAHVVQAPSPWSFDLPDRLDKALKVAGVGTAEMAEALDVSRNTISNYTSGRTRPSKLQLKEWAIRTGAPLEWLETGIDPTGGDETPSSTVESRRFRNVTAFADFRSDHIAPVTQIRAAVR